MKLGVIIASANRPDHLLDTVRSVLGQTRLPDQILVVVPESQSTHVFPEMMDLPRVEVVRCEAGLTRQRNRGVEALRLDTDLVLFFDDDVELRSDYLLRMERLFVEQPDVCLATGQELLDGNNFDGGLTRPHAHRVVQADGEYLLGDSPVTTPIDPYIVYGCNMAVRRSVLRLETFDTRLPLYSWFEDYDFGLRCVKHGKLVRILNCRLVHLAVRSGRMAEDKMGFSQVINPIYVWQKNSNYKLSKMIYHVSRMVAANFVYLMLPVRFRRRPSVDRKGLVRGNWLAISMLLRGRIEPEYILKMKR